MTDNQDQRSAPKAPAKWTKPCVKAITPVRGTRGGPTVTVNPTQTEQPFYSPS